MNDSCLDGNRAACGNSITVGHSRTEKGQR